jgi:hypothetical protein
VSTVGSCSRAGSGLSGDKRSSLFWHGFENVYCFDPNRFFLKCDKFFSYHLLFLHLIWANDEALTLPWHTFLVPQQCVNLTFYQLVALSFKLLVRFLLRQLVILSSCHFIILQIVVFIILLFPYIVNSSNFCLINWLCHQLFVSSTSCFING